MSFVYKVWKLDLGTEFSVARTYPISFVRWPACARDRCWSVHVEKRVIWLFEFDDGFGEMKAIEGK